MEAADKKKLYVLAAALSILAAIWGYRLITGETVPDASKNAAAGRKAVQSPPGQLNVDLGLLDKDKPHLSISRNIFSPVYYVPKVVPPPPPPPPPAAERQVTVEPQAPVEWITPEQRARMSAENEMKQFRFLGFVKRRDRTDLFLTNDREFFYAGVGETITEDFYIKSIGADYFLIGDRDSGAEVRLNVDFGGDGKASQVLPSVGMGGPAPESGGARTPPQQRPGRPTPRRPGMPAPGRGGAFPPDRGGAFPPDNGGITDDTGGSVTGAPGGTGGNYIPKPPAPLEPHS
ncbi:MAG TPA: hypothetical protein VGB23_02235 [Nitrospirota bacterium]